MTSLFLFFITVVYIGLVIIHAKGVAAKIEMATYEGVLRAEEVSRKLGKQKGSLDAKKTNLQEEALEIFTLYEITKEITKSLNEQEAFEMFKRTLHGHVDFKGCRFLEPLSDEVKALRKEEKYFVFTLQSKKKKIGYLAIEGVLEKDKEKVKILGHQFALALRRVHLYQEIEQIAITDSLTDVHTRRHITERFQEELKRSKVRNIKMSFLMIDVDFFKKFNDQYGHLTGDQILRETGVLINENIREIDIAGRYGGEEFCVILPDTDYQGAKYAAERIRKAIEYAVIKAYDASVKITVSVGTSTFPDDGRKMDELIDKADWALYRAKKQGRNKVCSFGVYKDSNDKD
ncbi:MAG: GGDEF domain-containing protein [Candidatus Omnitrophica bacterium]|nr:GGDEF domain-containing protein [Candidatus Omnitrophota bacterium]